MVKKRDLAKKLLPVIGILLFIWIISKLELNSVIEIGKNIRWGFVVLTIIIAFVAMYIKAYKWKKLVDYTGMKYSTFNSFIAWITFFIRILLGKHSVEIEEN